MFILVLILASKVQNQLQIIQNKIVHFIMGAGPRTHIDQKELDNVSMLLSRDRVIQLKLNRIFKIFHNLSPDYMKMYLTRVSSVHRYSTKGSPFNFVVPRSKGQASFTFYTILPFITGTLCQTRSKIFTILNCSKKLRNI